MTTELLPKRLIQVLPRAEGGEGMPDGGVVMVGIEIGRAGQRGRTHNA